MKTALRLSIGLNLSLVAALVCAFVAGHQPKVSITVASEIKPLTSKPGPSAAQTMSHAGTGPLRWNQLVSTGDYRTFIANLRATGCPEATIEDIVWGDTQRVFSWERSQLGLGESGSGPWSRSRQMQLVASLLGTRSQSGKTIEQGGGSGMEGNGGGSEVTGSAAPEQVAANRRRGGGLGKDTGISMVSVSGGMDSPSYPLFLQNPDWGALGFTPEQQAAIAQVRQQFQSETSALSQNVDTAVGQVASTAPTAESRSVPDANGTDALTRWQKALQNANEQLSGMLGAQAYMAYEQQQYYAWYQPQVAAAAASADTLTINPAAFQ